MSRNQSSVVYMLEIVNNKIEKINNESGCQAKAGALVVLIFWPILRLAVLIKLVLIKKACK